MKKYLLSLLLMSRVFSIDYFPSCPDSCELVNHYAFAICYDSLKQEARWAAYPLTRSAARAKGTPRDNNFRVDPLVHGRSAAPRDYARTDLQKGLLAPTADFALSKLAMSETFYMSNAAPMMEAFARGHWTMCEEQIRKWAIAYDTLYVVSGPVLSRDLPRIGRRKSVIPKYFYKVICRVNRKDTTGIAFLLKNAKTAGPRKPLADFMLPIDSVQALTGLVFFPSLPDSMQVKIKSAVDTLKWFKPSDLKRRRGSRR